MFKKKQKKQKPNGLTLIEILVYLSILTVITVILVSSMIRLIDLYNFSRFNKEVLTNADSALKNMVLEIKSAQSVYMPTSNNNSQISLETSLNPPSGETAENKTYVDFYLDNGRLCMKREGQAPIVLTSEKVEVKNLNFTYLSSFLDPSAVKIEMTVSYRSPRPQYQKEITLKSTAALREIYE